MLVNFGEIPCGPHNFGEIADSGISQNLSKVVVEKRWKYGEWMREWEVMVRWCGGG